MLAALLIAGLATGQGLGPSIERAAQVAKQAFETHDFGPLLQGAPTVLIHFPDEPLSRRIRRVAAVAALSVHVARQQEIKVTVLGARVVEGQLAYIELQRDFRGRGVQERRSQRMLLSLRLTEGEWRVVEVLIV